MGRLLHIPGIHRICSFPRGGCEEAIQKHRWWGQPSPSDFWRAHNSLGRLWKIQLIKLGLQVRVELEWKIVVAGWVYCSVAQKMVVLLLHAHLVWKVCVCVCLKCQPQISIGPQLVLGLQCILGRDAANRTQLRAVFYVRQHSALFLSFYDMAGLL